MPSSTVYNLTYAELSSMLYNSTGLVGKLRECRDYRDKMIRDNIFKNSPDPATEYDVMLPADDGLYEVEDSHRVTTSQSLFTTPYSSEGVFHTQPLPSSTWRASKANKVG